MAADIYILRSGRTKPVGPFTLDEIRDMRFSGRLEAEDLYCKAGSEEWRPVPELFAQSVPVQSVFRLPGGGSPRGNVPAPRMERDGADRQILFEARKKSAAVALILNFLIPGAGYAYAGSIFLGLCVFILWAFLFLAGFAVGFPWLLASLIWLVGLVDAPFCAARANRKLAERLTGVRR